MKLKKNALQNRLFRKLPKNPKKNCQRNQNQLLKNCQRNHTNNVNGNIDRFF